MRYESVRSDLVLAAACCDEAARAAHEIARPLLSVIVPVYNEAATIDELLRRVVSSPVEKQVIVVDDGSTDGTLEVLERWEGHPQVELLAHARNRGKGAAMRTGLEQARGRYTLVQDADLEYDPGDYPRLLAPLLAGEADVIYGSRSLCRGVVETAADYNPAPRHPWSVLRLGVCALNVAARCLYGTRLSDEATCYKLFATNALKAMRLECERFEFCPEVTAKACRMGLRILEVPVHYVPRGRSDGKKIRWRDGLTALRTLWRWRHWEFHGFRPERAPARAAKLAAPSLDPVRAVGADAPPSDRANVAGAIE